MQLYDKLLGLPLFQGMSSSDLQDIVTRVKFGFLRYNKNQVIISREQPCKGLMFLLDGIVDMQTIADDGSYTVTEQLNMPTIIEPERIFGLHQRYTRQYKARTQCHLISVRKDDVMLLSSEFMVFRLNLLNIISTQSQRFSQQLWQKHPSTTEERIILFLRQHCNNNMGSKIFHIKMQQLADEINESRLDVSIALNALDAKQKIRLQRGIITIPEIENL